MKPPNKNSSKSQKHTKPSPNLKHARSTTNMATKASNSGNKVAAAAIMTPLTSSRDSSAAAAILDIHMANDEVLTWKYELVFL